MSITPHAISRTAEPYETEDGVQPFSDWLDSIRDVHTKGRIDARIRKIEEGGFGDHRHLGEGVFEARLAFGPGWRVYFGVDPGKIVLLWGGTKKGQTADIKNAKHFWADYKRRKGVGRAKGEK